MADPRIVEALERLVVGTVGMTAVALAEFAPASELTLQQWRTLVVVTRSDGVRIGEIAARVGLSLPSVSRLVQRLERRGLVTTERDERDRRGTIVRASPAGIDLWAGLAEHRRRMIADVLDGLPDPLPPDFAIALEQVDGAFARYA